MPFQKGHIFSKGQNNPFYGKKHTLETRKKMRLAKLGYPGNKWTLEQRITIIKKLTGKKRSIEIIQKMQKASKGKHYSPKTEFKKGHKPVCPFKKGHKVGNRFKKGIIAFPDKIMPRGDKHYNWKGGISSSYDKIKQSDEYKKWRRDIFIRDHFTCQKCGHRFIKIVAHHIKSFAEYKELWFDVDNGQTLCKKCHCKIHNPAKI